MSLQSEIADYRENELRELHELERFFKSLSFHSAIEYAASGVTPHRKIHPHQRGIGVKQLRQSAVLLKKYTPAISVGKPTIAQNQMFSDPTNRAIASARRRGRAPAIVVAPLTAAWVWRTTSTMRNYRVAHAMINLMVI